MDDTAFNQLITLEEGDYFNNNSTRCPLVLLLDNSDSMGWGSPPAISTLNKSVRDFLKSLSKNEYARRVTEILIITFSDNANIYGEWVHFQNLDKVSEDFELETNGLTALGKGLTLAIDKIEERQEFYRENKIPQLKPWLVIMTDGLPSDSWELPATEALMKKNKKEINIYALYCGDKSEYEIIKSDVLKKITPRVARVENVKMALFFEWLGKSMDLVSRSMPGDNITLPPRDDWDSDA